MCSCQCLVKLEFCSSLNYLLLMSDVNIENIRKRQNFRLVIDQRQHIYRAGVLQLCILV